MLQIKYKLFDGELFSDLAVANVSIKCPPGFHTRMLEDNGLPDFALEYLHSCTHCPPGTMVGSSLSIAKE